MSSLLRSIGTRLLAWLDAFAWWVHHREQTSSAGVAAADSPANDPLVLVSLGGASEPRRRSMRVSTEGVPLAVAASVNAPRISDAKPRRSLIVRENSPTHPSDVDELAAAYASINTHLLKGRAEYADA